MEQKAKKSLKLAVDGTLCVLLLCLMAYPVTGEVWHEWIGIAMTVLLIVHHGLNACWYASLFRGRYNAYRILVTVVNTALLASIALTALCGMSMSAHALPFLYGLLPVAFARRIHLALSYWSFLLMGLHLGLHLPAMTAGIRPGRAARIVLNLLFAGVAGFGLYAFVRNGIPGYLFFRTPFAFFDYGKPALLVFAENVAELFAFAWIGANAVRLTRKKKG